MLNKRSMPKIYNLAGKRYGKLTVISRERTTIVRKPLDWVCRCDCGRTRILKSWQLVRGEVTSCGCEISPRMFIIKQKSFSKTKEYVTWRNIKARCFNPGNIGYKHYGGRGITVCDYWRESYHNFLKDMGHAPKGKYSIDRINNNGNYEPGNCRWATDEQQANNRQKNRVFTIGNETKTLTQWINQYQVPLHRVWYRIKKGWDIERALTQPVSEKNNKRQKIALL